MTAFNGSRTPYAAPRPHLRQFDYSLVVKLHQEGWRNIDIAEHLRMSRHTVATILRRSRNAAPLVRSQAFKEALTNPKMHVVIAAAIKMCKLDEVTIESVAKTTGYSRGAIAGWLSGRTIPNFAAGVDFIQALGFRLTLEPIDEKVRVHHVVPAGPESRPPY